MPVSKQDQINLQLMEVKEKVVEWLNSELDPKYSGKLVSLALVEIAKGMEEEFFEQMIRQHIERSEKV
jgi:disulfide oxidoreductase YuzD